MDSTAKPAPPVAEDLLLARGDAKPNGDYERIVREELARVQERLAQLAPVGPAAAPPEVRIASNASDTSGANANHLDNNITAFRAAEINVAENGNMRPSHRRGVARVLVSLLVAGTIVGAGAAWAAYGEAAKPLIATWQPQLGQIWSQMSERFGLSGERGAAPADAATGNAAAPPATTSAQAAATPVASPAPDVGQMLQGMTRDIASLQQGIDELRAGQEQMARDNAKLSEQLKASQDQLSRVMAHASEQTMRPRLPPPPKPVVSAARRPMPAPAPTLPPPQTIAPPVQAQAETPPLPAGSRPPRPVP